MDVGDFRLEISAIHYFCLNCWPTVKMAGLPPQKPTHRVLVTSLKAECSGEPITRANQKLVSVIRHEVPPPFYSPKVSDGWDSFIVPGISQNSPRRWDVLELQSLPALHMCFHTTITFHKCDRAASSDGLLRFLNAYSNVLSPSGCWETNPSVGAGRQMSPSFWHSFKIWRTGYCEGRMQNARLFNKGAGMITAVTEKPVNWGFPSTTAEVIVERQTKRLLLGWIWLTSTLSSV